MGLLWKSGVYLARWGCEQSNVSLSHTFSDTLRIWRKNVRNVASKMSFHRDFAYGDQPFSQSGHILGPTKPRDTCNPRGTWKKQGLFQQALLGIPQHLAKAPWFTENLLLISFALSKASWCTAETKKRQTGQTEWLPIGIQWYLYPGKQVTTSGDLFEPCPATWTDVIVADHVELPAKHIAMEKIIVFHR